MKVMILGGAGYVGSLLCSKLLEDPRYDITVVDKGFFGFEGLSLHESKIRRMDGFDLTKRDLEGYDCFINLSGLSNDPMADFNPNLNKKLNTELTVYTAKLCKSQNVKYIFASTSSIYDFGFNDEKRDVLVDETTKVNPTKFYSLSKYNAERELLNLASNKFKVIILRKATICGWSPRMRYDLVLNTFIKDALKSNRINLNGGGENWRPLIDVSDACEMYIKSMGIKETGIYNMVGYNIRISELALRTVSVLKEYDYDVEIVCNYDFPKDKIRNYRVDGSKLHRVLNYKPQMSVNDTVRDILFDINENKDFDNPIYYNIEWTKKYLQHWLKY